MVNYLIQRPNKHRKLNRNEINPWNQMPLCDVDCCFEGSRDGPVNRKKTNESPEKKCTINQNPNHNKIHSSGSFSQYSTQQHGYLCLETSGSCDFPHSFFHKLQKCGYEKNNDDIRFPYSICWINYCIYCR